MLQLGQALRSDTVFFGIFIIQFAMDMALATETG